MRHATFSLFTLSLAIAAFSQTVPTTINYQGRLTDNTPSQTPVNATVQMQFALYDAATGGTRLWQEPAADNTGTSVAVTTGIFNYVLGNTVAIPATVFSGATSVRYLQITLDPATSAEILTPRQLITATGYANLAQNANSAVSATNATTVTNGVYTTGSYADPAWITSLSGTKISGAVTNSSQLGGVAAANWQRALATPACPANQYLTTINQNGTTVCAAAVVTETDPKVGTLTTGRVPYWNATSLVNGTMFDTGTQIGINTAAPIAPFHLAGANPVSLGAGAITGGSPRSVFVQGRYAYVVNFTGNSLQVFDISNPAAIPAAVGSAATAAGAFAVSVQGRYAYVVNSTANSLQVFDISSPAAIPAAVDSVTTAAGPRSLYIQGRYAYVLNFTGNSLQVFDISNPAVVPAAVGSATTGAGPWSIHVQGRYAFVTNFTASTMEVFDISNPAAIPAAVGSVATGTGPRSVFVKGRHAYVVNGASNTLQVFDISNPAAIPAAVGSVTTSSNPNSVHVQGRYAYVVNQTSNSLQVFDISDPAAIPAAVGSAATGSAPFFFQVQGRFAYVVNSTANRLQAFDLGGGYFQQVEAGGIETGTLNAASNVQFGGDAQVKGGLVVGSGGIYSAGSVAAPSFKGDLTGNATSATTAISATTATSATSATTAVNATNFTGSLTGDVTGTQAATVVGAVGGQTAANVAAGAALANAATNLNTASAIVRRDASGNFSTGTITAALSGNATTASALAANPANCVGGVAAGVAATGAAEGCVAAVSANTASAIVLRDASGNFSAGTISAALSGNATTSTSLAANGSNCAAGNFPLGMDASGNAENCAASNAHLHDAADIATGNLAAARMPTGGSWTLSSNLNMDSNTLVVDQTNNRVGIGMASPAFPLDIAAVTGNTHARFGTTRPLFLESDWPVIGFNAYYNSGNIYGTTGYAGNFAFDATTTGNFSFATAPSGAGGAGAPMTTRMTLTNAGLLGIGTTGPDAALTVASTASAFSPVRLGDSGCGANFGGIGLYGAMTGCNNYSFLGDSGATKNLLINRPTGANIHFRMNNADQMILDSTGRLGIGTTPTAQKLEVAGNIAVTGGYQQSGAGGEVLRIIRGSIDSNGVINGGSGFTISKSNPGQYSIYLSTPFSPDPSVTVTPRNCTDCLVDTSHDNLIIQVRIRSAGVYVDSRFDFIAIGTP